MKPSYTKPASYIRDALVDAFAPLVTYLVLHTLGVSAILSLSIGIGVAVVSTAVHTIRRRRLDGVGLLVIAEILVTVLIQVFVRDTRFLLIRPSLYSILGAIYLAVSATGVFGYRPLTYEGARPMATQGDPQRTLAYERAWSDMPDFRRLHIIATLGWSMAFFMDGILRIVIVYGVPTERAVWLGNVPHIAAVILLIGFSAMVGKKAKPLVDEQARLLTPA